MGSSSRLRDAAATRSAIKAAARALFAADGFEKTTIRAVAGAAGIDPALVMRYFGNKEGLLAAAADFDLRMPDLSAVPRETVGFGMAEHFLGRWEEDESFTALLRAAVTHQVAHDRLLEIVQAPELAAAVARLVLDPDSVQARVGLIASQVLGTALSRYVLRLPHVANMSRAELITWLGGILQGYLDEPAHRLDTDEA